LQVRATSYRAWLKIGVQRIDLFRSEADPDGLYIFQQPRPPAHAHQGMISSPCAFTQAIANCVGVCPFSFAIILVLRLSQVLYQILSLKTLEVVAVVIGRKGCFHFTGKQPFGRIGKGHYADTQFFAVGRRSLSIWRSANE